MTFKVGDLVVRKKDADNTLWLNECKFHKLEPFAVYQVRDAPYDGRLWLVGHPSRTVWVQDRFDLAFPPDKPLDHYM